MIPTKQLNLPLESPDQRIDRAMKVLKLVEKFAKDHDIGCAETIYQCDRVIENAYGFLEDLIETANAWSPWVDEEEVLLDSVIEIRDNDPSSNGHYSQDVRYGPYRLRSSDTDPVYEEEEEYDEPIGWRLFGNDGG